MVNKISLKNFVSIKNLLYLSVQDFTLTIKINNRVKRGVIKVVGRERGGI